MVIKESIMKRGTGAFNKELDRGCVLTKRRSIYMWYCAVEQCFVFDVSWEVRAEGDAT